MPHAASRGRASTGEGAIPSPGLCVRQLQCQPRPCAADRTRLGRGRQSALHAAVQLRPQEVAGCGARAGTRRGRCGGTGAQGRRGRDRARLEFGRGRAALLPAARQQPRGGAREFAGAAALLRGREAPSSSLVDARAVLATTQSQRIAAAYEYDLALAGLLAASHRVDDFTTYLARADRRLGDEQ